MQDQQGAHDTNGNPLPVTLVDEGTSVHLQTASKQGYTTLKDGTQVDPVDMLSAVIGPPDYCVVIMNSRSTPLMLFSAVRPHGDQAGYPALSNFVGKTAKRPHEIPATRPDPVYAGKTLYGVGVYSFASSAFSGSAGALVFSYKAKQAGPYV